MPHKYIINGKASRYPRPFLAHAVPPEALRNRRDDALPFEHDPTHSSDSAF